MADISIIIPVYNGEKWIDQCMNSILAQSVIQTSIKLEIVIFNDGSTDHTQELLERWAKLFISNGVLYTIASSNTSQGVGAAKNRAVERSTGQYLCFQDIDDLMHPHRILLQFKHAKLNHNSLIGSKICRVPKDSTPRLVHWANNLSHDQLKLQIYTSHGPTLLMPTWFCHRSVYQRVGGFNETGYGTPEDLIFFYKHLDAGGDLYRVDEELLIYTYHEGATTFSISRETIRSIQLSRLERHVLTKWSKFIVWNAGKLGRRLLRSLSIESLQKVTAFCDVDKNKIGRTIELYCPLKRNVIKRVPVIHYRDVKPPILICMKLGLTNGEFEMNLKSLNLKEGIEYVIYN